ncbi:MAG: DUF3419 family protein [Bdellovibrionales bacterium]
MYHNIPLKFATQPEDPLAEKEIIKENDIKSILGWASGGCNLLNLKAYFPDLNIVAFNDDLNETDHLKAKQSALKRKDYDLLNDEHPGQEGLNQSGKYESLLRIFRRFFYEFIIKHEAFENCFWDGNEEQKKEILENIFSNPAWKRSFEMFFSKPTLESIIGGTWSEDSCTHVRENIELLLSRSDIKLNYILSQCFFSEYKDDAKPHYLTKKGLDFDFPVLENHLKELSDFSKFELVSLGNYFDYLDEESIRSAVEFISSNSKPGQILIIRSLKDRMSSLSYLEKDFHIDRKRGDGLLKKDKSFLFSHMVICTRY